MTDPSLAPLPAKWQTQPIEDLLDVSRILQGKLSLNVAPVNLKPIIEAAIETVQVAAETKGIELCGVLGINSIDQRHHPPDHNS